MDTQKMSIDSLIAISNALSVSTDAILFGEIIYDKSKHLVKRCDVVHEKVNFS